MDSGLWVRTPQTLFPADTIVFLSELAVFLPSSLAQLWLQLLETPIGQTLGLTQICTPYVACFGGL
jgi:hypothetical protein